MKQLLLEALERVVTGFLVGVGGLAAYTLAQMAGLL